MSQITDAQNRQDIEADSDGRRIRQRGEFQPCLQAIDRHLTKGISGATPQALSIIQDGQPLLGKP
jgi:hypothetical protein